MYSSNDYLSACNIEKKILHNGGTNNVKVSIAEINKIESKKKKKKQTPKSKISIHITLLYLIILLWFSGSIFSVEKVKKVVTVT